MGWVTLLVLSAMTFAGLWVFMVNNSSLRQLLAAALLVAMAGYAWQGRPGLAGAPKAAVERGQIPESDFARTREEMLGRFDRAWFWLNISDGYARRGDTRSAAEVIHSGLRDSPRDPDLWAGYGSALVAHAGGLMSPAAELAFRRAEALAPGHPAPRFYYGLALAQGGQFAETEWIWRRLLAEAPPQAGYRATIERQLEALARARAASVR
ncbi:MAG: tetratricopeptide repeat protein [Sphingosinicella sp.]